MKKKLYILHGFRLSIAISLIGAIGLSLFLHQDVLSQTKITNGTTLVIENGSTLVSQGDFIIENGADVNIDGTLDLKGDLTNQHPGSDAIGDPTTGMVSFTGASVQDISGQNVFPTVSINNGAGVTLSGQTGAEGGLDLTSGHLILGNNNFHLGHLATISGAGPGTGLSYVITNGTGELRKEFIPTFLGSFVFPIGDNTSTVEYSPLEVNFNSATFVADNYVAARVVDAKYPDVNITDNYLTRYWELSSSNVSGFNCDATFTYTEDDVVITAPGTQDDIVTAKVSSAPWVTYSMTNASTHKLTANGLTTFSSFSGVDGKVNPPMDRTLADITIPIGTTTCYSAVNTLTVAGGVSTFVVQSGGNVTLIAGSKISLLPGTTVQSGGYLHAYISSTYCTPITLAPSLVDNNVGVEDSYILFGDAGDRFVKLYPNPTRDDVTLEVTNMNAFTDIRFEIYGMRGDKIMGKELQGIQTHKISLSGYPVGVYVIHVIAGDKSETAKIVKTN